MKAHEHARAMHLQKDAEGMVQGFSPEIIQVNRGKISRRTKTDDASRFRRYFDAVEFKKWDDVNPPVIRFSDDHSLAYMIVDKLVVLDTKDSVDNKIQETTHFAWVSIFRKQQDGEWQLECVASTNEPATFITVE